MVSLTHSLTRQSIYSFVWAFSWRASLANFVCCRGWTYKWTVTIEFVARPGLCGMLLYRAFVLFLLKKKRNKLTTMGRRNDCTSILFRHWIIVFPTKLYGILRIASIVINNAFGWVKTAQESSTCEHQMWWSSMRRHTNGHCQISEVFPLQ